MNPVEKVIVGFAAAIVLVLAFIVVAPAAGGIPVTYSDGVRSGYVTKISKKGVIYKTWEGELQLGGSTPGKNGTAVVNVWQFSVPDEKLAAQIQAAALSGERVTLRYNQVVMGAYYKGETDYYVIGIEVGE